MKVWNIFRITLYPVIYFNDASERDVEKFTCILATRPDSNRVYHGSPLIQMNENS